MMVIFLQMNWFLYKKQIDLVISSSLTVLFLSFGPKILSANQIPWFFNLQYLQNDLIIWLLSLCDSLVSWLAPMDHDEFQNSFWVPSNVKLVSKYFNPYYF